MSVCLSPSRPPRRPSNLDFDLPSDPRPRPTQAPSPTGRGKQPVPAAFSEPDAKELHDGAGSVPFKLREHLKRKTDAQHRRLDLAFADVATSLDAYGRFISMNHAAHEVLEPLVESAVRRFPVLSPFTAMRGYLDADRRALGLPRKALTPLPCEEDHLLLTAIGILYVLEGSRLGARFIRHRIEQNSVHGFADRGATRYLDATKAFFPRFDDRMTRFGSSLGNEIALSLVTQAAQNAFTIFERAADEPHHQRDGLLAVGKPELRE